MSGEEVDQPGVEQPEVAAPEIEQPEVALAEVPGLGTLYARGLGGSALAAARRDRTVDAQALTRTRVAVRGVQAEAGHLTAYQHLLRDSASDVLPAGFVHVLAFPVATALMVRGEFPLPLLGMVHVANSVEQHRALRLGEAMDIRVHAQDLRPHRAGTTVDIVAEVSSDGQTAWRGVSRYLAKGYRLDGDAPAADSAEVEEAAETQEPKAEFMPPVPTGQWRLTGDVGRRYATVSGDRNPIHTSNLAAKAFGFPRAIAHGMYTAARALAAVGPAHGESFAWDVDFAKPVLLPSTVAVRVAEDGASDDGFSYVVWSPKNARLHLSGSVRPL